jgi:hypothetical protein
MERVDPRPGMFANAGEPIRVSGLNLAGVSAKAARGGETTEIWTRMALTSDQALFHQIVPNLASALETVARNSGAHVSLARACTVFVVVRPDDTGEIWVDTAAMVTSCTLKRPGPLEAGAVLFENDVADTRGLWFPLVDVGPRDRVLCILREGWRFALYFDLDRSEDLSIDDARSTLGSLYRRMRYADLFATVADQPTFKALVTAGWFPFLELMSGEFRTLLEYQQAGWELAEAEQALVEKFDATRLDRIFARWMERPILKAKEAILRPAIAAFKAGEPVPVIKILLSEIEGVLATAYYQSKNERTHRIEKLLKFVIDLAQARAGGKDTLFFPIEFGHYLRDYIYVGFAPGDARAAGSRHAVGHGAVEADEYTMPRALQILLTMDQIAFYG